MMADNQSAAAPHTDGSGGDQAFYTKYADGVLYWADRDGDMGEPRGSLTEDCIALVLQRPETDGGYTVFSLAGDGAESPFKLSRLVARHLSDEILERYLVEKLPDHLLCDANHRLTVVVSTHSGTRQAEAFYTDVLRPLLLALGLSGERDWSKDKHEDKYEVLITESDQTVKDLGKAVRRTTAQARTFVLLSGDGGVVDLLNGPDDEPPTTSAPGIGGPNPTIALLPLGTGNALFHSLHKPLYASTQASHHVLALRTLFTGRPAPLPTFEASFAPGSRVVSYGAEGAREGRAVARLEGAIVASYGFHASLVWESDTPAYRVHGDKRFGMAAAELLKVGHGYEVEVHVRRRGGSGGEGEWERLGREGKRFGYVLATLVSNLEKTFTISPDSRPLDGRLRLVTFGDVGGERTMDVMKAAYEGGKHVGMRWEGEEDGVGYEEVREVRVTVREEEERWRKVCVDGTIVEVPAGGWMRVRTVPGARFGIVVGQGVV